METHRLATYGGRTRADLGLAELCSSLGFSPRVRLPPESVRRSMWWFQLKELLP